MNKMVSSKIYRKIDRPRDKQIDIKLNEMNKKYQVSIKIDRQTQRQIDRIQLFEMN